MFETRLDFNLILDIDITFLNAMTSLLFKFCYNSTLCRYIMNWIFQQAARKFTTGWHETSCEGVYDKCEAFCVSTFAPLKRALIFTWLKFSFIVSNNVW